MERIIRRVDPKSFYIVVEGVRVVGEGLGHHLGYKHIKEGMNGERRNVKIDMVGKNIELTAAIKQYIEEKIGRVYRYFDPILGVKVVVEKERQAREPVFDVEVTLDATEAYSCRSGRPRSLCCH